MSPVDAIHGRMRELGHRVFTGDHNMNVVGLRTNTAASFDDWMTLSFQVAGVWKLHAWRCTTDPQGRYLANPMTQLGAAIIKPGQYRGSHRIGMFAPGKPWAHRALVQVGKLQVWHDSNRDRVVDYGNVETTSGPTAGLCIHRNLGDSAGCQQFQRNDDFAEFMRLCDLQVAAGLGDRFTYTLIDWTGGF